jgi:energy-coupling factor transporter ATP-binding protein EcfA2
MKIKKIELTNFKRFHHLTVEIPECKLVVLAGPNGSGKSSLFEGFNTWSRQAGGFGLNQDASYYSKDGAQWTSSGFFQNVRVEFHTASTPPFSGQEAVRKSFYIRSAYRNDPQFDVSELVRRGKAIDERRFNWLIDNDAAIASNYQRLALHALEDAFANEAPSTTIGEFREKVIGEIRASMRRVFPDLVLNDFGNPLQSGTFRFDKGTSRRFHYKNLSGGEKAAFDLLLDIVVKRREFDDTVFCIDEPEAHMNTRMQSALLQELFDLVPTNSQLWLATHSAGMMRRARDIEKRLPGSVAFLDFGDVDFDVPQILTPAVPTRAFWERVLNVAFDDLSSLVAPEHVVICEGAATGKNANFDASCYNRIFELEFPDVRFVSGGNATDVQSDRLAVAACIAAIAHGCTVDRLIDRDSHSPSDIAQLRAQGFRILSRRNLESYLYEDEVLMALCTRAGKSAEIANLLADKKAALAGSTARFNAPDDLKSAAGEIYNAAKQRLVLTNPGNDARAFARNMLAPLIEPGMKVYEELRNDIFG